MAEEKDGGSSNPCVPVSWGELIDKITILEIKSARLADPSALNNVKKELSLLMEKASPMLAGSSRVASLKSELNDANKSLWDIEDRIREKERVRMFDAEFIELARAIYKTNDRRAEIKRHINIHLASDLVEEKSYQKY